MVDSASTHSKHPRGPGFIQIYGCMGLPLLGLFLLCASWTVMLAVIQVAPTHVANYLMGTGGFDFGEFWLLPHPRKHIAIPAALSLVVFALGYTGLALQMLIPSLSSCQRFHAAANLVRIQPVTVPQQDTVASSKSLWSWPRPSSQRWPSSKKIYTEKKQPSHVRLRFDWLLQCVRTTVIHNVDHPVLALPKLVFQTTTLATYLSEGFPLLLVFSYSSLLLINWLIACFRIQREHHPDPHLVATRVFSSFDLFFAVLAPLQVLVYAYHSFAFDKELFTARLSVLTNDSFGRTARLFAEPTGISLFHIAFQHLQLLSLDKLFIKCALNVVTIAKWQRVLAQLTVAATLSHDGQRQQQDSMELSSAVASRASRWHRVRRLVLVATFCSTGLGIFVHSIVAVVSSRHVCSAYTQCKVPSYQWNVGATHCSCIVFVDRETKLKTMAEWENPRNISDTLAALAFTGHLKIIQIVNRQLPTLPDELRQCRHLEKLILIYTKIRTIPQWASELTSLEYLHIEGDLTTTQLISMPRDLFVGMDHLLFLHLGCHLELPVLPELNSLKRLENLVLAMLHAITEIPTIDQLVNLKRLSVIDNIRLTRLPSVRPLELLATFELLHRIPVCCNGFLPAKCDLSVFSCIDRTALGEPQIQCSSDHILPQEYAKLLATDGSVCPPNLPFDLKDMAPTFATTDESCGGVQYRQCSLHGVTGMCYPARMMPVSCQLDPEYVAMRRLEIQRRLGDVCDPEVEQWLGCGDP